MERPLPLTVTMSEFRDNLAAYLDAVEQGRIVTITRHGRPSARLETARAAPAPIDAADLRAFRASLGVRTGTSAARLPGVMSGPERTCSQCVVQSER